MGVDVGGTKTYLALIDRNGHVCEATQRGTVAGQAETIQHLVAEMIGDFLTDAGVSQGQIAGVGIGIPGLIDRTTRAIVTCPNLPSWEGMDLESTLAETLRLPVRIENDVNLAALGEHWVGAGRGTKQLACVYVGTGIGCGLILNGQLHTGWQGIAGELGHTTMVVDGEKCPCGNRGCLETVAAGWGIAEMARRAAHQGRLASLARTLPAGPEGIRAEHVFEAARGGDAEARSVIDVASNYLGIGLANLINLVDPEMIILGGGVVDGGGPQLVEAVARVSASRCRATSDRRCRVIVGALRPNAAVVGCGTLFWMDAGAPPTQGIRAGAKGGG